jgi:hypothetical protein
MKRSIVLVTAMAVLLTLLLPGCSSSNQSGSFSMIVSHDEIKGNAIVGQHLIYLVSIEDDQGEGPIRIMASGINCTTWVKPENVEGEYAEVYVVPDEENEGKTVSVTITASRGGYEKSKTVTFEVVPGEDDRGPKAAELMEKFIPWLAEKHPEIGITTDTVWEGTTVSPQWLVVSHYLFISEEWEMHIAWHNMIPPHDWVRIDLRKRFEEDKPSYAFEISSVTANDEPIAIEVPDDIWR